jgi:hypothetical protein
MIWALLAAFLVRRPAWMQAVVFGTCVGLFVAAEAYSREPLISSALVVTGTVAVLTGGAFYLALRTRSGGTWTAGPPTWVHAAYVGAWLLAIGAATRALVGGAGLRVAALAAVPIVLLGAPAIVGIRALLHRPSGMASTGSEAGISGESPAGHRG